MKLIHQILPITHWASAYNKAQLKGDIFAGLTVGIMLIPQGMAYALIAGLPPVYGLYASIVPQIMYAIFGTSRQLSVGPVAMDSLLVAAGVSMMATEGTEAYIQLALLVAFFMGLFQFLLGVFRLGFITNLLSKPVITGFTSAAAFIIGLNQLKYLLGIEITKSNRIYEILYHSAVNINETHVITLLIGLAGILIIQVIKKFNRNIPGGLIAVVLGTLLVFQFNLHSSGVSIVEDIPRGLPIPQWPSWDLAQLSSIVPLALTISIIAFMEAYSVAKAIEAKKRSYKIEPNQELIALGIANVVGSIFQSYPVTGGFSRSAVNDEAGAHTPLSSLVSAGLIAATLLFLTPLFYYLPEAILASIIMVAVYGLIDSKYVKYLWRTNKIEFALLLITFLITVNFSMVSGIIGGITLSILLLLYRAAYPHIAILGRVEGHHEFRNIYRFDNLEQWPNLFILRIDAPLTFINIQYVKNFVLEKVQGQGQQIDTIILDCGPISDIDATATSGLMELILTLELANIRLLLCELIGPVRDKLHSSGLIDKVAKDHVLLDLNEAVRFATTHHQGRFKDYALQSNISK